MKKFEKQGTKTQLSTMLLVLLTLGIIFVGCSVKEQLTEVLHPLGPYSEKDEKMTSAVIKAGNYKFAKGEKCWQCDGSGQLLATCKVCKGTKKSKTGNICQRCGGLGYVYIFCNVCKGDGIID